MFPYLHEQTNNKSFNFLCSSVQQKAGGQTWNTLNCYASWYMCKGCVTEFLNLLRGPFSWLKYSALQQNVGETNKNTGKKGRLSAEQRCVGRLCADFFHHITFLVSQTFLCYCIQWTGVVDPIFKRGTRRCASIIAPITLLSIAGRVYSGCWRGGLSQLSNLGFRVQFRFLPWAWNSGAAFHSGAC